MRKNMKKYSLILIVIIGMLFLFNMLSVKEKKIVENKQKGSMYVYLLNNDLLVETNTIMQFKNSEENIKDIIHFMKQDIDPFSKLLNANTILDKVVVKDKIAHLYFEELDYDKQKELRVLESFIYACTQFKDVNQIELYLKDTVLESMPIQHLPILFKDTRFKMNHSDMNQQYLHVGEYVNVYYNRKIDGKVYDVLKAVKIKDKSDYEAFIHLLLNQTSGISLLTSPLAKYPIRLDKCYYQDGILEIYTNSGILSKNNKMNATILKYLKKNLKQFTNIDYLRIYANDKLIYINKKDKVKIER